MANILLVSNNTYNNAALRTNSAFVEAGHTCTILSEASAIALTDADVSAYDVIAAVYIQNVYNSSGYYVLTTRDWLRDRWAAGKPMLFGPDLRGATDGYITSMYEDHGVVADVQVRSAISGSAQMIDIADHPIATGFAAASTVTVTGGTNFSMRDRGGASGTRIGSVGGSVGTGTYMTAMEVGDLLPVGNAKPPGGHAPARAVFCGWLYAGEVDYSADGKKLIRNTVDWLMGITPGTVSTPGAASPLALGTPAGTPRPSAITVSGTAIGLALTAVPGEPPPTTVSVAGVVEPMTLANPAGRPAVQIHIAGEAQGLICDVPRGFGNLADIITVASQDPTLEATPSTVEITLSGAAADTDVTFSFDGTTINTLTTDGSGGLYPTSLTIPARPAGTYQLQATDGTSSGFLSIVVLSDPDRLPVELVDDQPPVAVPGQTGVQKWVLQDLRPGGLGTWQMPINPTTSGGPLHSKALSPGRAAYAGGQHHITGGAPQVTERALRGYISTQAEHDTLVAFAELNRRFWMIDHRDRAYIVTFTACSLTPRPRQASSSGFNDWAHDYEITAAIFSEDWSTLT